MKNILIVLLVGLMKQTTETLCFVANKTEVITAPLDITGICKNISGIPKDFEQYYDPVTISGVTMCVTKCSPFNHNSINCNRGQCSITQQGLHCYCEVSDQFWYTGDRCQTAISKPAVYGGVTVGLTVLIIITVTLAIISHRRRPQLNKSKSINNEKHLNENEWKDNTQETGKPNNVYDSLKGSDISSFHSNMNKVNP